MHSDFRLGPWLVKPGLNTLSQNGSSAHLEPKVMEVLVCLAASAGEPVSKEAILKTVWLDTFVSDDVLTRSISELRRVFEDDPREPRFIQTIPKRGYRLLAAVTPVNGSSAAASLPLVNVKQPIESKRNWRVTGLALVGTILGCGLLIGLTNGKLRDRVFGSHPPIRSLAVLPLKNFSDDPQQKYFAAGMTEELITDLSQISALKVISRTSSDLYEGTHKSLPEIARELNVDAVIEGSVERSGNRVRVTAQLIDAQRDKNVWARSYERDLQDALALQGTVANAIAEEIKVQINPKEQGRLSSLRAVDPSVLDAYMNGNFHLRRVGRSRVFSTRDRRGRQVRSRVHWFGIRPQ
jgi:TolB-like protein/DNA-binding winged helix-turn-helix (wHTH) protein